MLLFIRAERGRKGRVGSGTRGRVALVFHHNQSDLSIYPWDFEAKGRRPQRMDDTQQHPAHAEVVFAFQHVPVQIELEGVVEVVAVWQVDERGAHLPERIHADLLRPFPIPYCDATVRVEAEAIGLSRDL